MFVISMQINSETPINFCLILVSLIPEFAKVKQIWRIMVKFFSLGMIPTIDI